MAVDINNKALRGSISQILLNALVSGDKYGYEICKDIEQKSNGKLLLKQPSLYSSLRRMEGQGLITSYWADSDLGGRRHYYSITEKGRKHYEKKQVNWNEFGDIINALPSTENDSDSLDHAPTLVQKNTIKDSTKVTRSDFGVIKQENLFSMPAMKTLEEDASAGETFIQFDMFEQKPNFIKTTATTTDEVFSTFKSKFSDIATNSIEPEDDIDTKKEIIEASSETTSKNTILANDVLFSEETFEKTQTEHKQPASISDIKQEEEQYKQNSLSALSLENLLTKDNIDNNEINKDLTKLSKDSNIIDSSDKYFAQNKKFDSYSFVDKQQEENYVPTGKFAYTKDSDNIYGNDFSQLEQESLKGSLESFLNDEEDIKETSLFNPEIEEVFISKNNNNEIYSPEQKTTIDDVIPKPKAFDEYDEVLKDDERIDVPTYASTINKDIEYVGSENNGSFIKQKPKQDPNYKDKLGNLYSDISQVNPYNKPLAEEMVSLDSEEIFESPKQDFKPNYTNDLVSLQEDLAQDGIKLRIYNKSSYTKTKQDNYINYSLISLVKGWIVWLFVIAEIVATGLILSANQLLPIAQHSFYYWAGGLSLLYPIYYTIAYIIDPYKKIASTFKINISLFNKFLAMMINIILIFAINLFFGMTSLNQLQYLSYWLLPVILTTNYILSTLIYFILLKGKKFSI